MIRQSCEVYGLEKKMSHIHDSIMHNNHGGFSLIEVDTNLDWKFETIV